jgi:hypothetical protein
MCQRDRREYRTVPVQCLSGPRQLWRGKSHMAPVADQLASRLASSLCHLVEEQLTMINSPSCAYHQT